MPSPPAAGVCHVVYARYPADPRVRREAEALARRGFEVDVIGLRAPGESRRETVAGVHVTRLPLVAVRGSRMRYVYQYLLYCLLASVALAKEQIRGRYKIVHVHSMPDFLVLATLPGRLLGGSIVLDLHESMPELYLARFPDRYGSFVHRLTRAVQRISCAFASQVVTVNALIGQMLLRQGVAPSRITIVENAPDLLSRFANGRDASGTATPEIIIVSGLNPERDLENVLRAAARLKGRVSLRWRIIGRGDPAYVAGLRRMTADSGILGDVTIEPEVPATAVPGLVQHSVVGIVSYRRNPITEIATPNKAYEYAFAGKAMVVADLPGLRALLSDAVLYYPPGDAEALADRIQALLSDEVLRNKLGTAVRERIQDHRWEIMEDRLVQMYRELLRPHSFAGGRAVLPSDDSRPGGH